MSTKSITGTGEYVPHRFYYICYVCTRHMAL